MPSVPIPPDQSISIPSAEETESSALVDGDNVDVDDTHINVDVVDEQDAQADDAAEAQASEPRSARPVLTVVPPPPHKELPKDPHAWSRQQVWAIRYHKRFNQDQKRRLLHNFILTHENRKGPGPTPLVVAQGKPYLLDQQQCRLYRIDREDGEFTGYLQSRYGLNTEDATTKHLVASLRAAAYAQGARPDVHRWVHYDRIAQVLYVSRHDGTCYRLDGSGDYARVANGRGVLFLDDDRGVTCADPAIGNHHLLFRHLIDDLNYAPSSAGGMCPEVQKTCLGIWLFAIAFPDLLPTKPLLLVEGEHGSGKTLALKRIARALHGRAAPLTISPREDPDFGVKILRSPIAIIDDVNKPADWLQDTLCTYATGGRWTTRKKYKDDDEHEIKPQSFLNITTNNPTTFRQGQLADRCLVLRLQRREGTVGFTAEDELLSVVDHWRPELYGEWLYWLDEIVCELRCKPTAPPGRFRMADFARLAHVIGRVLNQPAGPPGNWSPSAIDEMLAAMQSEQTALVLEGDPLPELLDKWLDIASNQGREVKAADLHRELMTIAVNAKIDFGYKSAKALAFRLRTANAALDRVVEVTRTPTGHAGLATYSFRRR